jgi:hypothetical protein
MDEGESIFSIEDIQRLGTDQTLRIRCLCRPSLRSVSSVSTKDLTSEFVTATALTS